MCNSSLDMTPLTRLRATSTRLCVSVAQCHFLRFGCQYFFVVEGTAPIGFWEPNAKPARLIFRNVQRFHGLVEGPGRKPTESGRRPGRSARLVWPKQPGGLVPGYSLG